MFILRKITSRGIESNLCLGNYYVVVYKETNPEEFKNATESANIPIGDELYGIVTYENGSEIFPLYTLASHFIMTSNGKTFSNITFKK